VDSASCFYRAGTRVETDHVPRCSTGGASAAVPRERAVPACCASWPGALSLYYRGEIRFSNKTAAGLLSLSFRAHVPDPAKQSPAREKKNLCGLRKERNGARRHVPEVVEKLVNAGLPLVEQSKPGAGAATQANFFRRQLTGSPSCRDVVSRETGDKADIIFKVARRRGPRGSRAGNARGAGR